jgi:ATP-binding cassette, subfamily B, bacterial
MKSSLDGVQLKQASAIKSLPPTLSSMWHLCRFGYRQAQRLMISALGLSQLAALPPVLLAVWLALLGEGVVQHRNGLVLGAAVGMAVSTAATWFMTTISTRLQRRFRDKVTMALEAHVARLQASIVSVAHPERPEYLDRLAMLRNQVFVLDHMYLSLFTTLGWLLLLAVTLVLLARVHPVLLLLGVFALPTTIASFWRPDVARKAQERGARQSGFHVICSILQSQIRPATSIAMDTMELSRNAGAARHACRSIV